MTDQFPQYDKQHQLNGGWESLEVAQEWRTSGLARHLQREIFEPYLEAHMRKSGGIIQRRLTFNECAAEAVDLQKYTDFFHRIGGRFFKFVAIGLSGVMTISADRNKTESIVFVEFGARSADDYLGLPSMPLNQSARVVDDAIVPSQLEVFSSPVGIVARKCEDAAATIELLYSAPAYSDARQHLNLTAVEVEIWRHGLPFADYSQLTERSALLANIISKIETDLRNPEAFVLAIRSLESLGPDRYRISVVVGQADRAQILNLPASMQLHFQDYTVTTQLGTNGTIEISCSEVGDRQSASFSDSSLREASHLWLLKYKAIANHFGVANTAEAFSWQQRDQESQMDRERFERLLG